MINLKNICLSLLLATTSCQQKDTHAELKQVLRLNLPDDPSSLDPRLVRNLKDLAVVKQLFEGLMRIDKDGIPQPALAEDINISADRLTYTFHLRESYWSNFDPVTAYDFEYAWKTVLDRNFASDYAYMLYPIKNAQIARQGKCSPDAIGITALDARTLKVELQFPIPYFLEIVSLPIYYPVNHKLDLQQKNWALPSSKHFVCNGPFCLKKWMTQKDIILKKNPVYWDSEAVYLDSITFSVIPDNNTENQLFEKNEIDWLGQPISHNISTEMISKLKEKETICSYSVAGTFWFLFNTEKKPFDNMKLRQAFAHAINRQEIITHILQGNQSIAISPLPPAVTKITTPYFVDEKMQEAQKLLDECFIETGWTLQTLPKIVLCYPPNERNSKIVQQVQQQWKHVLGIDVELSAMENQLYQSKVRQGAFQLGVGSWVADFNDPLSFLELFKYRNDSTADRGMNCTGWQNMTFTSLLDQSLVEWNPEKRNVLLSQAEQILIDEMPIAPVYHFAFDYIKKTYVQDVVLTPFGSIDFKTAKIQSDFKGKRT